MSQRFVSWLMIGLWGVMVIILPNQVKAATPLTRAEIQNVQNLVQLLLRNSKKRPARMSDPIIPGDGLSTGRASLADLRFNDGSLARVGERAVFQFLPKTRNFRLSNGTVLLLIPPGRGQTRIQTPSAAAAIRGSALFVRYDKPTDTTIVGALTNSGIEVFNRDASQSQVLSSGQLMVIVKGEFQGLYDFDLRSFYKTSNLVKGLDLTQNNLTSNPDPAIASVQAEIAAALAAQQPLAGNGVIENPSFTQLSVDSSNLVEQGVVLDNSPVDTLVEAGEVISDTNRDTGNGENINTIIPNPPNGNVNSGNSSTDSRGNNTGGGVTPGGGDNTGGGITPGGGDNTGGGITPGGGDNTGGGVTPGGGDNTGGGITPGGGDNTGGGITPGGGDNTGGGITPGGGDNTGGGITPGGGDNTSGGITPGGGDNTSGSGNAGGGDNTGGGTGGSNTGGEPPVEYPKP